ncbi:hypothetical protein PG984_007913 [Apiospora sp. TS-2023a]
MDHKATFCSGPADVLAPADTPGDPRYLQANDEDGGDRGTNQVPNQPDWDQALDAFADNADAGQDDELLDDTEEVAEALDLQEPTQVLVSPLPEFVHHLSAINATTSRLGSLPGSLQSRDFPERPSSAFVLRLEEVTGSSAC